MELQEWHDKLREVEGEDFSRCCRTVEGRRLYERLREEHSELLKPWDGGWITATEWFTRARIKAYRSRQNYEDRAQGVQVGQAWS